MHGRAGRENLPGKVIIQTYNPENFSIECSKKQDYNMFYNTEIALRKQLKYPPFCDIIIIRFVSTDEKEIIRLSELVYKYLNKELQKYSFNIFKPMPAPIDKIQKNFRWRIIAKGNVTREVNEILNNCLKKVYSLNNKVNISIDINPNSMI